MSLFKKSEERMRVAAAATTGIIIKDSLEDAIAFAAIKHKGQVDLGGQPYILHPIRVMQRVSDGGLNHMIMKIAVLHDVVEDCGLAVLEEIHHAFGEAVMKGVNWLTRSPRESYEDYITLLKTAPDFVKKIKCADLRDNLDPLRVLPNAKESIRARHKQALAILERNLATGL